MKLHDVLGNVAKVWEFMRISNKLCEFLKSIMNLAESYDNLLETENGEPG